MRWCDTGLRTWSGVGPCVAACVQSAAGPFVFRSRPGWVATCSIRYMTVVFESCARCDYISSNVPWTHKHGRSGVKVKIRAKIARYHRFRTGTNGGSSPPVNSRVTRLTRTGYDCLLCRNVGVSDKVQQQTLDRPPCSLYLSNSVREQFVKVDQLSVGHDPPMVSDHRSRIASRARFNSETSYSSLPPWSPWPSFTSSRNAPFTTGSGAPSATPSTSCGSRCGSGSTAMTFGLPSSSPGGKHAVSNSESVGVTPQPPALLLKNTLLLSIYSAAQ